MSAWAVRTVVLVVCALGIAGMIISSIADQTGAAIAFGLGTAAAVLCSMVATAVATGSGPAASRGEVDERQAALVEELVERVVEQGADEHEVRNLVRQAMRLGRGAGGL